MAARTLSLGQVGWYGKIPAAGDFVARDLPYALLRGWEHWMQQGLAALQQADPQMLPRHYAVAPVWNFLLPAGLGADYVQLGSLAPSCDRVGRYYPVAAMLQLPLAGFVGTGLDQAAVIYEHTGAALLAAIRHGHSPDRLSSALASLPGAWRGAMPRSSAPGVLDPAATGVTAWPGLSQYFDAGGTTSFWWTHQGDGSPLQTHAHTGALNNALFARLFGPQGYAA
ncbi:type VI secretion system-associated protein TagF [Chitinolyticbacter meiyuanensis]|uniref:type VI secretion system-associated protein TagF n=1 Tax=Chitinolyticbacter meiyuanensis TaxID=682798 RepID=UPI001C9E89BD|nr:type VI secretion system-associated protein TagF [Chitinolyticbacter meiyuanensis]